MLKKVAKNISILALLVLSCAAEAASPRISSPYVEKDRTAVQWMSYYAVDEDSDKNDAWRQRLLLAHGITDRWRSSIRLSFEDEGGRNDNPEIKAFGVENTLQLTEKGEYFFDVGVKADYEYAFHEDDADIASGRLLLAKDTENFLHLINFRVDHGIGGSEDNGFSGGVSFSTRYKYIGELQPGLEFYNEFGRFDNVQGFRNEDRSGGPVVHGTIGDFRYHAGYIFGLSKEATDGVAKLAIEYKF